MRHSVIAAVALAGALALGVSAPAVAQTESPYSGQPVQNEVVAPGGVVAISSGPTGLQPDTVITILIDGPTAVTISTAVQTTAQTVVDANGEFTFGVQVPADAPAGAQYTGTASGTDDLDVTFVLDFEIVIAGAADDAAPDAGDLPFTGAASTTAIVWFGIGALVLGATIVVAVMLRRRAQANA